MFLFPGNRALSDFRIAEIEQQIEADLVASNIAGNKAISANFSTTVNREAGTGELRQHNSNSVTIRAIWTHFVCLIDPATINDDVHRSLRKLLNYDESYPSDDTLARALVAAIDQSCESGNKVSSNSHRSLVWVLPREGTISPWSSKATNIAFVSGLAPYIERIERGIAFMLDFGNYDAQKALPKIAHLLHDRMTQIWTLERPSKDALFSFNTAAPVTLVDIDQRNFERAVETLRERNSALGLALADSEIEYLACNFSDGGELSKHKPTDVELFMFAQVNSEHCRHKIFNAAWTIDGEPRNTSLFDMIRNTHKLNPHNTISAYSDNAAVMAGFDSNVFAVDNSTREWTSTRRLQHWLAKVETHNHPTAVSPYEGAATGSGGEIRDEAAVGSGSRTKAGISGFAVSDLLIPGHIQPWESSEIGLPSHISSALDIMIKAPIGSANYNNEFGRPAICGFFRSALQQTENEHGARETWGFHKPIMIAGGFGSVLHENALKKKISPNARLIVIGGPAMLIGLGGGAASSLALTDKSTDLDFASVQRGNAEEQRRAQMFIDACANLGNDNPIQSIHDVGAGGLSNAFPELVHDSELGAIFDLRAIPCAEPGMSPMQLWCCEAQERYVLAVDPKNIEMVKEIAKRERCPLADVGVATEEERLVLEDPKFGNKPIDLPMSVLFGKTPKLQMSDEYISQKLVEFDASLLTYLPASNNDEDRLSEALTRVLHLPTVGNKSFLITIGDRTITGIVARDQMVGPWQVPVADVGVCYSSISTDCVRGESVAVGERPQLAIISASASAGMAVGEALTNLVGSDLTSLTNVRFSANWMSSPKHKGEGAKLYEAVQYVGLDLAPYLGASIPVGKDSMSMSMKWCENGTDKDVTSPLSLVISAFCSVENVERTWTPQIERNSDTLIVLVDLANGKQRLGASALTQVFKEVGSDGPSVQKELLKSFLQACKKLHERSDAILAYHDRSDGGLIVTLLEMAFAGRCGLDIDIKDYAHSEDFKDTVAALFAEELGAVFQIKSKDFDWFTNELSRAGVSNTAVHTVAKVRDDQKICIRNGTMRLLEHSRGDLQQEWSFTSHQIQRLRDNPVCADAEYENIRDDSDPGLQYRTTFTGYVPREFTSRPKIALLREEGSNGYYDLAFAFDTVGFSVVDVHMNDLMSGTTDLDDFRGIAACGGFSYGDVLGAGQGWAFSALLNEESRKKFDRFFRERKDTFALGICNGCQLFSRLNELIDGAEQWPLVKRNISEQFEARVCSLRIGESGRKSVFLRNLVGQVLPTPTAHGEGCIQFVNAATEQQFFADGLDAAVYVDNYGAETQRYPFNPNGSVRALAGFQSRDGRFLTMMPHPERSILKEANSWYPRDSGWGHFGPWIQMFVSARQWVG